MIKDYASSNEELQTFRNFWEAPLMGAHVSFTSLYRWPWTGQTHDIIATCPKIKDEMFVICDGRVVLCCWDVKPRQVVGDLNRDGVLDIWNGPALGQCRVLLDNGCRDQIGLCSRCDAYKHLEIEEEDDE